MLKKDKILPIIYEAIDNINENLPKNKRLEKKPETNLFGQEGKLDSLGLVNLIVNIESLIYDNFELSLTLANEKAMSLNNSPFKSVQSLVDYIISLNLE
jgi:D-alanine--poly(phosphoribitol) ligase subunit 2